MITKEVDIYLLRDTERAHIKAVQGDSGNNVIVHIKDMEIPAGAMARAYVEKPSGKAVYNIATITGNDVLFNLSEQMLAEAGVSTCQVHLYKSEKTITTFYFYIYVEALKGAEAAESRTEMNVFDEAVEQARERISSVIDATLTTANVAADAKATGDAIRGKQDTLTFDSAPTADSTNPVASGGIKSAIDGTKWVATDPNNDGNIVIVKGG